MRKYTVTVEIPPPYGGRCCFCACPLHHYPEISGGPRRCALDLSRKVRDLDGEVIMVPGPKCPRYPKRRAHK